MIGQALGPGGRECRVRLNFKKMSQRAEHMTRKKTGPMSEKRSGGRPSRTRRSSSVFIYIVAHVHLVLDATALTTLCLQILDCQDIIISDLTIATLKHGASSVPLLPSWLVWRREGKPRTSGRPVTPQRDSMRFVHASSHEATTPVA